MMMQSTDDRLALNGLKPAQISVLEQVWRTFTGTGFDDAKLRMLQVHRMSGAEIRLAFKELRKQGWIHAVKKAWGERLYYIPLHRLSQLAELYGSLENSADRHAVAKLKQEGRTGLVTDLFNVLVYVSKHGLSLTAKGVLHKKHVQRMSQILALSSDDLKEFDLPYDSIDVYPPQVAIIIDLLLALGLLKPESGSFRLHAPALYSWLSLTEEAMAGRLFQCLLQRYLNSEPEIQHAVWLLCSPALSAEVWHADVQIMQRLKDMRLLPETKQSRMLRDLRAWLQLLTGAGWVDLGENERGEVLFRWRTRTGAQLLAVDPQRMQDETGGGHIAPLIIQPDFEVLIPPETPYTVRLMTAKLAERVADDHMSVYRLSRESLATAADAGLDPEQAISFLEEHAAGGIPNMVAAALRQWSREIGRTAFMELTVLACSSHEEGDLIENHPQLKDDVKRLGPLYFAVKRDRITDIRRLLTAAGLQPKRGIATLEEAAGLLILDLPPVSPVLVETGGDGELNEEKPSFQATPSAGLIRLTHPELLYRPDASEPQEDDSPGLTQLPVMWIRDLRSYHLSTAKQIMEQAVQLALKVEISLDGSRKEFIPEKLLRNPWGVSGILYEPETDKPGVNVQLGEGEWQEMRLIVP